MKKALLCALALLLAALASPVLADGGAVLPVLAGEICVAAGGHATEEGLGDVQALYVCQVTYTGCYAGIPITCYGDETCSSGAGWVECDGNRTYCPPCTVSCWEPSRTCTSQVGDCEIWGTPSDPYKIRCDTVVIGCP